MVDALFLLICFFIDIILVDILFVSCIFWLIYFLVDVYFGWCIILGWYIFCWYFLVDIGTFFCIHHVKIIHAFSFFCSYHAKMVHLLQSWEKKRVSFHPQVKSYWNAVVTLLVGLIILIKEYWRQIDFSFGSAKTEWQTNFKICTTWCKNINEKIIFVWIIFQKCWLLGPFFPSFHLWPKEYKGSQRFKLGSLSKGNQRKLIKFDRSVPQGNQGGVKPLELLRSENKNSRFKQIHVKKLREKLDFSWQIPNNGSQKIFKIW